MASINDYFNGILRSAALEQRQADVLVAVFKVVLFIEYPYAVVENVLLYALTIHFHSIPFARQAGGVFILVEEEINQLTLNSSRYIPLRICLFVRRLKHLPLHHERASQKSFRTCLTGRLYSESTCHLSRCSKMFHQGVM